MAKKLIFIYVVNYVDVISNGEKRNVGRTDVGSGNKVLYDTMGTIRDTKIYNY